MHFRLNLQWKVLLLVAGSMAVIILTSSYLHRSTVLSLIERDHYDSAIGQTLALAGRISNYDYFSHLEDLQQEIQLVAESRQDFRQIDVYDASTDGNHLIGTTRRDAPPLSSLEALAADSGHAESKQPLPGVSSQEVISGGTPYWLITVAINNRLHSGSISVLVLRGPQRSLASNLLRQYYLVLVATVAASVVLLYLLFVYFFRHPSQDIVSAMLKARSGQLQVRAAVRRDDELGDIARGFNQLMDDLNARDRERDELLQRISEFNNELLSRVEVATRELRGANKALFETQQRLAYSERLAAVGQVAAELAHEIGTPLNAISGHLQLLARLHPESDDTQRRISIINAQLAYIVQTVKSLLERTHRKRLVLRTVDLNALVGESLWLVAPTLDSHHIKVSVTLDKELPCVLADHDSLRQVFLNLVNNSIDAMPNGGRLEIRTRLERETGMAVLTFRDSGTGIAPDLIDRIFEPMWTTKPTGSGLGLAISRQIMMEHGGQIECITGLSQGVEFSLRFPLAGEAEKVKMEVEADVT